MSEDIAATPYAAPGSNAAGDALRAAREAAGLSIDAVAQHLKLAPRQVRALEDGDYGALPGRTFVRGFARNYARLLELDADAIVAALPEAVAPSAHEIGVTTRGMGELPVTQPSRGASWSRWLIPLFLLALIGAAAYYELTRSKPPAPPSGKPLEVRPVPMDPVAPPGLSGAPLPNPLASSELPPSASSAAEAATAAAPAATLAPSEASVTPTLPITTAPASVAAAPEQATLVISYKGASWTEVRDANGQRILATIGAAGTSETVRGTPPFDLTIGNAAQTSVRWQGAPFDLAPHTRGNVARVRLP